MLNGIIGRKLNQTQGFLENGKRVPLSLISVAGNRVTQLKSMEADKYSAVQLGFGDKKKVNKSVVGHIKKAGIEKSPRFFREIRTEDTASFELGKEVNVSEVLEPGDVIDVTGTSKGKGYAGVVKRHHFRGGPRTHGQSDRERAPGSSGQTTTPGRVYKGKRMSGRMGTETVTIKNLIVVDIKDDVLYVKGLVPGIKGALLMISKAKENKLSKALKKKHVPLFKAAVEEVADNPETGEEVMVAAQEPVITTIEVDSLPEEPLGVTKPEEIKAEVASVTEEVVKETAVPEEKVEEKEEVKKE